MDSKVKQEEEEDLFLTSNHNLINKDEHLPEARKSALTLGLKQIKSIKKIKVS